MVDVEFNMEGTELNIVMGENLTEQFEGSFRQSGIRVEENKHIAGGKAGACVTLSAPAALTTAKSDSFRKSNLIRAINTAAVGHDYLDSGVQPSYVIDAGRQDGLLVQSWNDNREVHYASRWSDPF